ncbi:MAG: GNAT family N-acetyltransferase [Chthoniobacterales bacterium]
MRLKKAIPAGISADRGLQFELRIPNDPRALAAAQMFSREILRHTSLRENTVDGLSRLIITATKDAIEHAYPPGEIGSVIISSIQDEHQIIITIRDHGLPQDLQQFEAALHVKNPAGQKMPGMDSIHVADALHWISYGPEGKALQITKWLHETSITDHPDRGNLVPFEEQTPLAPVQEYEIRRMRSGEAVQISQLIYKAYGDSYFNCDVYYPDRVASLNESGDLLSFVAADKSGMLVGHYALERNQDGPVAEGGMAVVDPAHRGRHLLERLKDAAIATAKDLNLTGMFADAVTVHTFTQKANIEHGARLACINPGISPKEEIFKGINQDTQTQRVTCALYFLWLKSPTPQLIFPPLRHRDALIKLYANLQCALTFGEPRAPEGHGEQVIHFNKNAGTAFLRVNKIGVDSIAVIRHARRELVEKSHAEAVFVELPLSDTATPAVADALATEGFFFCGVAPQFGMKGDLLRLVYLVSELTPEAIHLQEDIAKWLLDYALADRLRVTTE